MHLMRRKEKTSMCMDYVQCFPSSIYVNSNDVLGFGFNKMIVFYFDFLYIDGTNLRPCPESVNSVMKQKGIGVPNFMTLPADSVHFQVWKRMEEYGTLRGTILTMHPKQGNQFCFFLQ